MFKKILGALMGVLLIAGVASAEITSGVYSSYKNKLEVQWIKGDTEESYFEFVMIEDIGRCTDRLRDRGGWGPDFMVHGFYTGDGVYVIYAQMMFGMFPIGTFSWDHLIKVVPGWDVFEGLDAKPVKFQTGAGFEDIWTYFEFNKEDMEKVKSHIRRLNAEDLVQYDGNGGR